MNHLTDEAKAMLTDARNRGDRDLVDLILNSGSCALPSVEKTRDADFLGDNVKQAGRIEKGKNPDHSTTLSALDEKHLVL